MLCPLLPLLPLSLRLVWLTLRRFLRRLFFLSSDMELLEQRMVSPVSLCGSGQWPVWPLTRARVLHHLPMMTLAKLSSRAGLGSRIISPGRFSRQGQVFITRLAENITTLDMITRHQMTRGQGLMTRKHETRSRWVCQMWSILFLLPVQRDSNNKQVDL